MSETSKSLLLGLAVAAAAVALYAGSVDYELVGLDDQALVLRDLEYNSNPENVLACFGHNFFDKYYRPLHRISFIWDAHRGGADLAVYHRTNIALHGLGALLVFTALLALGTARATAFVLGLGFAVHPLLASVVSWIPGRDNALVTILLLGSLVALIRFLDAEDAARRALWLTLHWLGFAAGLFTKEMAAVFPAVALAYLAWYRVEPLATRRNGVLAAGWLAVGGAWALLRARAMAGSAEWESIGLDALVRSAPTILDLMGKFVAPIHLSAFAHYDPLELFAGAIAWAALGLFFARSTRVQKGRILFGVAWFGIFLAPTLLQRTGLYAYGEYRAYWLAFGLLVVLAEVLRALRVDFRRPLPLALAGVVIAGLAARSVAYAPTFDGELAFWSQMVERNPDSGWGWFHVGRARSRQGELESAERAYQRATELRFDQVDVFVDLAALRIERENFDGAEAAALHALAIESDNVLAHYNLGVARLRAGRYEAAIEPLERVVAPELERRLDQRKGGGVRIRARAYDQLGSCYFALQREVDAHQAWHTAIAADPSHHAPYVKLISRRLATGDVAGARRLAAELSRQGGELPDPLRRRLESEPGRRPGQQRSPSGRDLPHQD